MNRIWTQLDLSLQQNTRSMIFMVLDFYNPIILYIYIFKNYCHKNIIIDYYMAFFISHVISTQDAHISPRAEGPKANLGRGLIWHVI